MPSPNHLCLKCGAVVEAGLLRVHDWKGRAVRLQFVIPGVPTSANPFTAFQQGMMQEQDDQAFDLQDIHACRCPDCGFLEIYAF